jgi:biotin operon repressor
MSAAMHDDVPTRRGRPKGITGKKKDINSDQRYQHVKQLYLSGLNYEDIGARLGVTRQRIEQMVSKLDLVPQRKRMADRRAVVAGAIVRKSLTTRQAAEMFGCSVHYVYTCCVEHGVEPASMTVEEKAELGRLASEVVSGASIRRAAGLDSAKARKLSRMLKRNGIKAKGRSKHDSFEHRYALLNEWRSAGKTWHEIGDLLSDHDGRPIGWMSVNQWARRHMPHLFKQSDEAAA